MDLLASEVRHVTWDLPQGFDSIQFHLLGLGTRGWLPPRSDQLAVISPFCTAEALRRLAGTSASPTALVSRPEELGCLPAPARERFSRVLVLAEQAEGEVPDDGEAPAKEERSWGLHAKAYLLKRGWRTHVFIGSANATDAALLHGSNVEILAELVGKQTRVGGVDDLLSDRGFGGVLDEFHVPDEPTSVDPQEEAAIRALEAARAALAAAELGLRCSGEDELWRVTLQAGAPVGLSGVDSLRVWVVTQSDARAEDGAPLARGEPVRFPPMALASVCGFMAFELRAASAPEPLRFVLNLPLEGLPADRVSAIIRSIVHDRDAFLRYLLLLLGALGPDAGADPSPDASPGWTRWQAGAGRMEEMPLLEDMTRALSRDPSRLRSIQRLLRDLEAPANPAVVPPEFVALWEVFEAALPRGKA